MRRFIVALSAGALALSLTGCIPSGNIVGKATFTAMDLSIPDQLATVEINGGVIATPKGFRFRVTRANLEIGSRVFTATKLNEYEAGVVIKPAFAEARLKGKNSCGYVNGFLIDGRPFFITLYDNSVVQDPSFPPNSQVLYFGVGQGEFEWMGYAPANSLKIGGRNLCNYS